MFYTKKIILGFALTSVSLSFSSHLGPEYCPGRNANLRYSEACLDQALIKAEKLKVELAAKREREEEVAARNLAARRESPIFYHQDQKPSKYDLAMAEIYSDETYSGNEKAERRKSFKYKKDADNKRAAARQEIKNKKLGNRRN